MVATLTHAEIRTVEVSAKALELQDLVTRLNAGWEMIDAAKAAGEDVTTLENHWLRLLREYERLHADG